MQNRFKQYVLKLLERDAKKYILFAALFFAGTVIAAVFCGTTVPEEEIKSYIRDFIENSKTVGTDGAKTFLLSMTQYIRFAFFMTVFSVTVVGAPLIFGYTVFAGFSYGTVLVCLFRVFGMRAMLLFLCAIFPHILISAPCCLCLACACLKNAGQVYHGHTELSKNVLYPCFYSCVFLCAVSASSLVQSFLEPLLLKWIAGQFL